MRYLAHHRGVWLALAGAVLLARALTTDSAFEWWMPPTVCAAPGFRYVFPPIETASSLPYIDRLKYAETVEKTVNGKLTCDLAEDEYLRCRPDVNTDLVRLEEEIHGDRRLLKLAVRGKTPRGGHSMPLSEYGCDGSIGLAKCLNLSLTKFRVALSDHSDKCHLPGKVCEDRY